MHSGHISASDDQRSGYDVRPRLHSEQEYFTDIALHESQTWIEAVTGKSFRYPNDARRSLQDGVLLCELLVGLKPGCIKKVNRLQTPIAGLDNLTVFLNACRQHFGLQDSQLFDMHDLEDLRLRDSIEFEEELLYETTKRLRNVVITIFWLGKVVHSYNNGAPMLDLNAFHNLVEAPLTPLTRSELSLPSLTSGAPISPPLNHDRVNSPAYSPGGQHSSVNSPGLHRGSSPQIISPGYLPVGKQNNSSGFQKSNSPRVNSPVSQHSNSSIDTCSQSTNYGQPKQLLSENHGRQSPYLQHSPQHTALEVNCPDQQVENNQMPPVVGPQDRLLLTRSVIEASRSPVGSPGVSKPPQRQLSTPHTKDNRLAQRQSSTPVVNNQRLQQQHQQQHHAKQSEDNWEENLSNWKSRRSSQRNSESLSPAHERVPSPQSSTTNKNLSFKHPSSGLHGDQLEESVLAMFGFSRADYTSNDATIAANRQSEIQQNAVRGPANLSRRPYELKPKSNDVWHQDKVLDSYPNTQHHAVLSDQELVVRPLVISPLKSNKPASRQSLDTHIPQEKEAPAYYDTKLWLDKRTPFQRHLDFTLCGGMLHNKPIIVESVTPGSLAEGRGLLAGDELIAVNEASLAKHYLESVIAVIDSALDVQPVALTVRRYRHVSPSTPSHSSSPQTATLNTSSASSFLSLSAPVSPRTPEPPQTLHLDAPSSPIASSVRQQILLNTRSLPHKATPSPPISPEQEAVPAKLKSPSSPPPPLPSAPPPCVPLASHQKSSFLPEVGFCVDDEEGWSFIDDESASQRRDLSGIEEEEEHQELTLDAIYTQPAAESIPVEHGNAYSSKSSSPSKKAINLQQTDPHGNQSHSEGKVSRSANCVSSFSLSTNAQMSASVPGDTITQGVNAQMSASVPGNTITRNSRETETFERESYGRREEVDHGVIVSSDLSQTHFTVRDSKCVENNTRVCEARANGTSHKMEETDMTQTHEKNEVGKSVKSDQDHIQASITDLNTVSDELSRALKNTRPEPIDTTSKQVQMRKSSSSSRCDIDARVSQDMEITLAYQPKNVDEHQSLKFDLDAERRRMEQWALEQEQKRQEKFSREQDELKAKHQIELERAKQLEQELHKKEEQKMTLVLAKQKDVEDLAKKREEELKARLRKIGVEPLRPIEKNAFSEKLVSTVVDERQKSQEPRDIEVVVRPPFNDDLGTLSKDNSMISAEVLFTEVIPEHGQFELILTDSEDFNSSEDDTPVEQTIQVVPNDFTSTSLSPSSPRVQSTGTSETRSSPRTTQSPSLQVNPSVTIEVSGSPARTKSPDVSTVITEPAAVLRKTQSPSLQTAGNDVVIYPAEQWKDSRREVMEACKPKPSGWLWMENQTSEETHSEQVRRRSSQSSSAKYYEENRCNRDLDHVTNDPSLPRANNRLVGSKPQQGSARTVGINLQQGSVTASTQSSSSSDFISMRNRGHVETSTLTSSEMSHSSQPPRPMPPPRIDSVRPLEMTKTSRIRHNESSSTKISSHNSTQSVESQYFSESIQSRDGRSPDGRSSSTSYRVQVERRPSPPASLIPCPTEETTIGKEPQAVDALFNYHQMPSTVDSPPTTLLSSRCSPAAKTGSRMMTHF